MIRNERQRINKKRVCDCVYRVDLDGYIYNDFDLETISSAFFYNEEDARIYALKHCNDKNVWAAYVYGADGEDVIDWCEVWEDIVEASSYELKFVEYSDIYWESGR